MSASAYRQTCDQLGACQGRATPCQNCPAASEGTQSARRLLADRVDTADLRAPVRVVIGETDAPQQPPLAQQHPEDWGPWTLREYLLALALGFASLGLVAFVMFGAHRFAEATRWLWR